MGSTSTEVVKFSNIGATTAAFTLRGGKYAVAANATGAGTMGLQILGADGSTFIPVFTAFAVVTGYAVIDLPPGSYNFLVSGFTAVFATICRVPS